MTARSRDGRDLSKKRWKSVLPGQVDERDVLLYTKNYSPTMAHFTSEDTSDCCVMKD
jgi:hypothetical protein